MQLAQIAVTFYMVIIPFPGKPYDVPKNYADMDACMSDAASQIADFKVNHPNDPRVPVDVKFYCRKFGSSF